MASDLYLDLCLDLCLDLYRYLGMTLTQVSTWFANARRRLKKENGLKEDTDESIDDKGLKLIEYCNPF